MPQLGITKHIPLNPKDESFGPTYHGLLPPDVHTKTFSAISTVSRSMNHICLVTSFCTDAGPMIPARSSLYTSSARMCVVHPYGA